MRILILTFLLLSSWSCTSQTAQKASMDSDFSIAKVKPTIQTLGTTWSKALKSKDISLLQNLYAEDAHYLPNDAQAFHGNEAIIGYWKASMDFIGDIQLTMESLEGTKDLLYETGNGFVKVMNDQGEFFDMPFKYVNVWALQSDGTYKVVIDTYNNPAQ